MGRDHHHYWSEEEESWWLGPSQKTKRIKFNGDKIIVSKFADGDEVFNNIG
jgi:hypothetical protein